MEEFARSPSGSLISGWAALRLHRVNFCDGRDDRLRELPVPVVLPPRRSMRPVGIEVHRGVVRESERTVRFGVSCTTSVRALFDAMSWAPDERAGVVLADMAFAARAVARLAFERYVEGRAGDKGAAKVSLMLPLTEVRSRSPKETQMRLIWVLDAGLPRPRCNWPVLGPGGRRVGRPDLLCEGLAVVGEFDGADHRDAVVQAVDVAKEGDYRNLGLESFRIVGRDLEDTELVVARMHSAVRRAEQAQRLRLWTIPTDPGRL